MNVLIAEDDPVSRRLLEATLTKWGYGVVTCSDGAEAWRTLQREGTPPLVILDWMMPGMDGVEVCRKVRERPHDPLVYIILLTAKGRSEDVVAGLEAGADDYIVKPFDREELHARVRAGTRVLDLQQKLADRVRENAQLDMLAQTTRALAHHVRNAITPILGMAELLDAEKMPEGASLKHIAIQEGNRIAAIIDALIEMSETGVAPTVPYAGQGSKQMLNMDPLIQRYLEKRGIKPR